MVNFRTLVLFCHSIQGRVHARREIESNCRVRPDAGAQNIEIAARREYALNAPRDTRRSG